MYQAVAYKKRTNTVHVWDDKKGHVQIKYKPYAYAKNPNGQHIALDGTPVLIKLPYLSGMGSFSSDGMKVWEAVILILSPKRKIAENAENLISEA